MKYLIILLLSITTMFSSENDSVVYFQKKDVLVLANKVQSLKDSINYFKDIVKAQDTVIDLQKVRLDFYNSQLQNRNYIVDACEKRSIELEKINESLQPKWYDNKLLWFFNGVATVVAIVLVVK
jgi:hypothetical protein